MLAMKVKRGVEQFTAGLYTPERFDERAVKRSCFVRAERRRSFAQNHVEPFLHYLIAQNPVAGSVSGGEPLQSDCLLGRIGGVDRIYEQIGVEEKPTAHFALRG